nr:NnrU family protein [Pseudovibrio hongkongensis]
MGILLCLGVHSVPMFSKPYADLKAAKGEKSIEGVFGLCAIAGLGLIIYGFGVAREQGGNELYYTPLWGRHLAWLLMLVSFVLLASVYLPGNIKRIAVHPMISAVILWALAHLLANAESYAVLLFASFLVWGGVDRVSAQIRQPQASGIPSGKKALRNDFLAVITGSLLYLAFTMKLHEWLFGVSPL